MREIDGIENVEQDFLPEQFSHIFSQLNPQDVEQFYKGYQLWTLQKQIELQQLQIATLEQKIAENAEQMQRCCPSAIALSTLAQFQACGVNDIGLLDKMLERGEPWLDHTMQLLERCESLDMIRGGYTQWCEHALEGAYDWIFSMDQATPLPEAVEVATNGSEQFDEATEELLLQKLMLDDEGETEKLPVLRIPRQTEQPPTEKVEADLSAEIEELALADEAVELPLAIAPEATEQPPTDEVEELLAPTTIIPDTEEVIISAQDIPVTEEVIISTQDIADAEQTIAQAEESLPTIIDAAPEPGDATETVQTQQEEAPPIADLQPLTASDFIAEPADIVTAEPAQTEQEEVLATEVADEAEATTASPEYAKSATTLEELPVEISPAAAEQESSVEVTPVPTEQEHTGSDEVDLTLEETQTEIKAVSSQADVADDEKDITQEETQAGIKAMSSQMDVADDEMATPTEEELTRDATTIITEEIPAHVESALASANIIIDAPDAQEEELLVPVTPALDFSLASSEEILLSLEKSLAEDMSAAQSNAADEKAFEVKAETEEKNADHEDDQALPPFTPGIPQQWKQHVLYEIPADDMPSDEVPLVVVKSPPVPINAARQNIWGSEVAEKPVKRKGFWARLLGWLLGR